VQTIPESLEGHHINTTFLFIPFTFSPKANLGMEKTVTLTDQTKVWKTLSLFTIMLTMAWLG